MDPASPAKDTNQESDFPNPIRQSNGCYANPWTSWKDKGVKDVFTWLWKDKNNSLVPSTEVLNQSLPVKTPNFGLDIPEDGVKMTWLGHATVLIQMDGVRVLCDPVFSQRCSPSQYFGPKRFRPVPCEVEELPILDAVVISHSHYDHLDVDSVKRLHRSQLLLHEARGMNTHILWCVPAGIGSWMLGTLNEHCHVEELSWWQEVHLPHRQDVRIAFTPAQHWSGRSPFDRNKSLWGSWCILGQKHRAFFGGDTGYCSVFKQIGQRYGPFDMAALPIGAYDPRWFMSPQHVDPEEAVKIHSDIASKRSLGIHWGTFILTNEPYMEPPSKLRACLEAAGLSLQDFMTVHHGQTLYSKDDGSHEVV